MKRYRARRKKRKEIKRALRELASIRIKLGSSSIRTAPVLIEDRNMKLDEIHQLEKELAKL